MSEKEVCYKCGMEVYGKAMMGHLQEECTKPCGDDPCGFFIREKKKIEVPNSAYVMADVRPGFSIDTVDKIGLTGRSLLVLYQFKKFKHTGNGKVYTVTGVNWMGELDLWGLVHKSPEGVKCVRSVENFLGNRSNGTIRYNQCSDD